MSTVADYVGRQADILAWDWDTVPAGEELLTPTLALAGAGGKIIAGISKLGQRFLLELLTQKGSMRYKPDNGTDFMTSLRAGFIRTNEEVQQEFASALIDIKRTLTREENDSDPDDEKFSDAELLDVLIVDDKLSIRVLIVSVAGTTRDILVPLTTAVGV